MLRIINRTLLWACGTVGAAALLYGALLVRPDPLFAYSLGAGMIVASSDQPIPSTGGERFLHDCERLLERSPLKPMYSQYRVYIAYESWRHRLFFAAAPSAWGVTYTVIGGSPFLSPVNFEAGRIVHWGYVGTPPRTAAWLCAHELTHIIEHEHVGLAQLRVPQWVWEGFADYVGVENRETFEQLREALGDRRVDIPMMVKYGSYPRYRLLVTFFLEKKSWSVDRLLQTRLTEDEANAIMNADAKL